MKSFMLEHFLKEKREDFNTPSPSIYGIWYFNIFILL